MKELSIEEKVEAYDKVSKEVKDFFEGKRKMCSDVTKALEDLFPELKESEDEKIKRTLNEYFKERKNESVSETWFGGISYNKILSWLEKQGEPNPYSGTSFEYNGHTWGMCARDGGVEISYDGNLKAFLSSEKSFIYPNNHSQESTAPEPIMEAVKEESVSNGNKLKFQIGDWIVNPKGEALHITNIKDSCYIFNNDESHYWITCYCDQKCHLWTIEDARDGDVLAASDSSIFIFAGMTNGCCKYHAVLTTADGRILVNKDKKKDHYWETTKGARPATMEQREILFQKMKDARWEWNADKKELKRL